MSTLCPQCKTLLEHQSISLHSGLSEVKHVHNNTLYVCRDCDSHIGLISVPHRWELIEIEATQQRVA